MTAEHKEGHQEVTGGEEAEEINREEEKVDEEEEDKVDGEDREVNGKEDDENNRVNSRKPPASQMATRKWRKSTGKKRNRRGREGS